MTDRDPTILVERLEAAMAGWRLGHALAGRRDLRPSWVDDPALAQDIDLILATEEPYVLMPAAIGRAIFAHYCRREADLAAGRLSPDAALTGGERRIETLIGIGDDAGLPGGWIERLDRLDDGDLGVLELAASLEPTLAPADKAMRPALLLHFWLQQIAPRRVECDPPPLSELLVWLSFRGLPQNAFDLPSERMDEADVVPFRRRPRPEVPAVRWSSLAASGTDLRNSPDDRATNDLHFAFRRGLDAHGREAVEAIVTHRTADSYNTYPLGMAFRLTVTTFGEAGVAPVVTHRRLVFGPGERGGHPVARAWFEPMPGRRHECQFEAVEGSDD